MRSWECERLLADVEAFCTELREHEEIAYVERRYNDRLVPLARKHKLLGIPVPVDYGGRGADAVTYARALARIGQRAGGVGSEGAGFTRHRVGGRHEGRGAETAATEEV